MSPLGDLPRGRSAFLPVSDILFLFLEMFSLPGLISDLEIILEGLIYEEIPLWNLFPSPDAYNTPPTPTSVAASWALLAHDVHLLLCPVTACRSASGAMGRSPRTAQAGANVIQAEGEEAGFSSQTHLSSNPGSAVHRQRGGGQTPLAWFPAHAVMTRVGCLGNGVTWGCSLPCLLHRCSINVPLSLYFSLWTLICNKKRLSPLVLCDRTGWVLPRAAQQKARPTCGPGRLCRRPTRLPKASLVPPAPDIPPALPKPPISSVSSTLESFFFPFARAFPGGRFRRGLVPACALCLGDAKPGLNGKCTACSRFLTHKLVGAFSIKLQSLDRSDLIAVRRRGVVCLESWDAFWNVSDDTFSPPRSPLSLERPSFRRQSYTTSCFPLWYSLLLSELLLQLLPICSNEVSRVLSRRFFHFPDLFLGFLFHFFLNTVLLFPLNMVLCE